jgi:hypothetical protein
MRVNRGELRPGHVVELLESLASAADGGGDESDASDCETLLKCAAAVDAVLVGNRSKNSMERIASPSPPGALWKLSRKTSELDAITSREMKIAVQKARSAVEAAKVARRVEELVKSWDEFVFASKVAFAMQRKSSEGKSSGLKSSKSRNRRAGK